MYNIRQGADKYGVREIGRLRIICYVYSGIQKRSFFSTGIPESEIPGDRYPQYVYLAYRL